MKWISIAAVLACATLVSAQRPGHPSLNGPAEVVQNLVDRPGPGRGLGVNIVPDQNVVSEKAPITDGTTGKQVYPVVELKGDKPVTRFYTAYKVGVLPPKPTNRGPQRINHEAALKEILNIE